MKDHPILFSAPMIRALLAGTKTQTRRIAKAPRGYQIVGASTGIDEPLLVCEDATDDGLVSCSDDRPPRVWVNAPHAPVGRRLWVRETWGLVRPLRDAEGIVDDVREWTEPIPKADPRGKRLMDDWHVGYKADGCEGRMRPSIHMPRWASRITLEVTRVRLERVQAITDEDARAEGVETAFPDLPPWHRENYRALWDTINGAGSWASNPWVWAYSFERVT